MNEFIQYMPESERVPCRSDIIAHKLGYSVSNLDDNSEYKAVFNKKNKTILYNKKLCKSDIRAIIGLGIVLFDNPFFHDEVIINQNENIYDSNHKYSALMKKTSQILVTKENIEIFIYDFKIYKIEDLSKEFNVSEELMYNRLKDLNFL